MKRTTINAEGYEIEVQFGGKNGDFVSLTDIARYKTSENPGYVIQNWMRNRNNAELIKSGLTRAERAIRLNQMAINQLKILNEHRSIKLLE